MPFIGPFLKVSTSTAAIGAAAWIFYTRNTLFVPFDATSPDFNSAIVRRFNPKLNKPVGIDCAVRRVPLSKLKTTDQEELTREFVRGLWGGPGFQVQRKFLERWHRHKDGRQDHLWDPEQLQASEYQVGTKMADHFEVVERTPSKARLHILHLISELND